MAGRVFAQVGLRQFVESCRRARPVFLQVNKRAGQLDQSLVKITVAAMFVLKPDMLQHIVRFIKFLLVEELKISRVVRIERTRPELVGHGGDAFALVAHDVIVNAER